MNQLAQDLANQPPGNIQVVAPPPAFGQMQLFTTKEIMAMPKGMRILFDPHLREFFENMAKQMANPRNQMTPDHLKDDPQLCFAIIRRALNWNMDPYEVAGCTYNVHGNLGYYGKLVRGIMLNSGKVKELKFEHGPSIEAWEKVEGVFKPVASKRTDKNGEPIMFNKAMYKPEDEEGLYIIGTAVMHDDSTRSTQKIMLKGCHPRNSTQWATSPMNQIIEVASRRLGDMAVPDAMFGATFDDGLSDPTPPPVVVQPDPANAKVINPDEGEDLELDPESVTPDDDDEGGDDNAKTSPAESPSNKTTDNRRISCVFRKKKVSRTTLRRDFPILVGQCETKDALAKLQQDLFAALQNQSDAHTALLEELNPIVIERRNALLDLERDQKETDEAEGGTHFDDLEDGTGGDDDDDDIEL